jgi:hypothetical protein
VRGDGTENGLKCERKLNRNVMKEVGDITIASHSILKYIFKCIKNGSSFGVGCKEKKNFFL